MTDKPTPTTDLLKRCAEIYEWRSAVLDLIDECPGLTMEQDRWLSRRVKELEFASAPRPTAQADSVPAVGREQERIAFKGAHRHLDLDEVPDAWGRLMFKHSHVEASWLGWIARAALAAQGGKA